MDASKFNRGIQLMYHNDTKQIGLSYAAGSVILKAPFSFIPQGYFGNGPNRKLEMPAIGEGEIYFLPFEAVLNQSNTPLLAVKPGSLSRCDTLESGDISALQGHSSPLPAFVNDRGYGLIYTSDESFMDHFETAPVYLSVDYTYQPEKKHVSKDHVIFLSMRSILLSALMCDDANWDPVEVVPLKAVAAYLPALYNNNQNAVTIRPAPLPTQAPRSLSKVTFNNSNNASSANFSAHRTPMVMAPTAVVRGQHKNSTDSKAYSEGLTTGGSNTSASSFAGSAMHSAHSDNVFADAHHQPLPFDAGSGRRVLTTSRLQVAPDTAHSSASDSERENEHNSPMSSLASSPVTARANKKSIVPSALVIGALTELRPRVPGHSDVFRDTGDTRRVNKASRAEQEEEARRAVTVRSFTQSTWPEILEMKGWIKNWSKNAQGDHHMSFLTPGWSNPVRMFPQLKECKFIENLEVWHSSEALCEHVAENPVLREVWTQAWARLHAAGWSRVEGNKGKDAGRTLYYYLNFTHNYRANGAGATGPAASASAKAKAPADPKTLDEARARGILPGQHLFVSRGALMKYIARFPYLLQDDLAFVQTLQRLNWTTERDSSGSVVAQWVLSSEDKSGAGAWQFKAPKHSPTHVWVSLTELRRRLWLVPERLFQHITPSLPAAVVLQALRLTDAEGEALDEDVLSPHVKGLAREDRDAAVEALQGLLEKYAQKYASPKAKVDEKLEESVRAALRRVGWVHKKCSWSKEWWQNEVAWLSPWCVTMIESREDEEENGEKVKEPVCGRDYFWTLLSVAQYAVEQVTPLGGAVNDYFYSPLLHAPPKYTPSATAVRAMEREHANNLVLKLVRNHKGNPFEEGPLKDMLVTTGWRVFGDNVADCVVFVPYWKAKEINIDNYNQYEANVDYFDTLGGVQSHLEDYGNKPAPVAVVSAPVYSTSNSTSNGTSGTGTGNAVSKTSTAAARTYLPSPEEYIVHLGKRHLLHSVEGSVVAELEGERYFVKIFNLLKHIGWGTAWIGNENSYMIAPWGYTRTAAFDEKMKKIKNLALLRENVDYFKFSDEGKVCLLEYLLKRGFEERIADFDPFAEVSADSNTSNSNGSSSVVKKEKGARTKAGKGPPKHANNANNNNTTSAMEVVESEVEEEVSSPTLSMVSSSSSGSDVSTIVHLGKTYDANSLQAQVVLELEGECYFARMIPALKLLGWGTSWIDNERSFIVTPWGYDNEAAFSDAKKKKIKNLGLLRENIDYFVFSDEGKLCMYEYLRKRGFRERLQDYDPFGTNNSQENSPEKAGEVEEKSSDKAGGKGKGAKSSKSSNGSTTTTTTTAQQQLGPVFTAEGVTFTNQFYDAESKEYRLIRQLFHHTPHFGQIYTSLKCDFLWGTHYVTGANMNMIFASWALEVDGAFTVDPRMRYKLQDLSVLEEGVDYFRDDSEGKTSMINYLKNNGIEGPSGRVISPPKMVPFHDDEEEFEAVEVVKVEKREVEKEVQQPQRKRKADASPERDTSLHTTLHAISTTTSTTANTNTNTATTAFRSRRGGALDPATEVCPVFKSDYETLRWQMKKGKFTLSTRAAAPLEMWLALSAINRSWRYQEGLQGQNWYFRTVGCNENTHGKFTEGLDYFRSLEAFWTFLVQQYTLHLDAHSLLSQEEKKNGGRIGGSSEEAAAQAERGRARSRASSIASRATLSPVASSSQHSTASANTANTANTASSKTKAETARTEQELRRFDGLTIRKRSPSKACYRAADPSSNLDRLVATIASPDDKHSQQTGETGESSDEDEETYFTRRKLDCEAAARQHSPTFSRAAYDVDMQEVFGDILKDSPAQPEGHGSSSGGASGHSGLNTDYDNDTEYLPLTQHLHGSAMDEASDEEEGEISVLDMLSMAQPPFQRILHQLQWTYEYVTANTAMPNGEPSAGLTHVYLRPGRALHTAGMVKGEDYFLTEESLIDYLRVQYGLQDMPQYVSNSKRPRATRSGRVIDGTSANDTNTTTSNTATAPRSAHSSPVVTTNKSLSAAVAPAVGAKPSAVGETLPVGEKRGRAASSSNTNATANTVVEQNQEPAKRLRTNSTTTASNNTTATTGTPPRAAPSKPAVVLSVSEVISNLKSASKQSAYSAGLQKSVTTATSSATPFAAPLGRELEHSELLSLVASSLINGAGGAAYVCGSPGMGKTHIVVSVLDAIAADRRNALPVPIMVGVSQANRGGASSPDSTSSSGSGSGGSASKGRDLGYHVVWLSGAGLKSKVDVYSRIASELQLRATSHSASNFQQPFQRGNSKSGRSEAEQLVIDRFSSPGAGITLQQLSTIDLIGSGSGAGAGTTTSAASPPRTGASNGGRGRYSMSTNTGSSLQDSASKASRPRKPVPMTVLVIDEMDMANKEAVAQLCLLATCAPSSLVIIGLGNVVNHVSSLNLSVHSAGTGASSKQVSKVQQMVLQPYNRGQLSAILHSLTGGLFKDAAVTFLAQKVEQNNKGDMRALLRHADAALTKASATSITSAASKGTESGSVNTAIVEVKHILEAYGSSKDPAIEVLQSFSARTVRLLVAMLKFETDQPNVGLTRHNIMVAYSNYLELKGLPTEETVSTSTRLDELENYSFVKVIKRNRTVPDQSLYSILVGVEVLLQANLGEGQVREELLQIKNNRQRREAEASLTQY